MPVISVSSSRCGWLTVICECDISWPYSLVMFKKDIVIIRDFRVSVRYNLIFNYNLCLHMRFLFVSPRRAAMPKLL